MNGLCLKSFTDLETNVSKEKTLGLCSSVAQFMFSLCKTLVNLAAPKREQNIHISDEVPEWVQKCAGKMNTLGFLAVLSKAVSLEHDTKQSEFLQKKFRNTYILNPEEFYT